MNKLLLALARANYGIGERLMARGEHQPAAGEFRRVLAVEPDFVACYAKLAQALTGMGAWREALDVLRRLALFHPEMAGSLRVERLSALRNLLLDACGPKIMQGPFAGMAFDRAMTDGWTLSRVVGFHEAGLHTHLESLAGRNHEVVLIIGCGDGGYLAVGLARRFPQAAVHAFDSDPAALEACRALAEANGVQDRLILGNAFTDGAFAPFAGRRVLVVCTASGVEDEVLDPVYHTEFVGFDVLVRLPGTGTPGLAEAIAERFRATHAVSMAAHRTPDPPAVPQALGALHPDDRSLAAQALGERASSWMVMTAADPTAVSEVDGFFYSKLRAWLEECGLDGAVAERYGNLRKLFTRFERLNIIEAFVIPDSFILFYLANTAARPGGIMLEIGSWLGCSTAIIGDVARGAGARVFAIDTWEGSEATWQKGVVSGFNVLTSFCGNMQKLGLLRSTVSPLVSRSDECAPLIADGSLDFIFIDGDHRYPVIRRDIALYWPKLKPGGLMCGHDCERYYADLDDATRARVDAAAGIDYIEGIGHPGVIRATHEAFGSAYRLAGNGSCIWWTTKPAAEPDAGDGA